jgi:hypothetical protein
VRDAGEFHKSPEPRAPANDPSGVAARRSASQRNAIEFAFCATRPESFRGTTSRDSKGRFVLAEWHSHCNPSGSIAEISGKEKTMQRRTHAKPKAKSTSKATTGRRGARSAKKRLPNDSNPNESKLARSTGTSKARMTKHDGDAGRPNSKSDASSRARFQRPEDTRDVQPNPARFSRPTAAKDEEFEDRDEADPEMGDDAGAMLDDEDGEEDDDEDFDDADLAFDEDDDGDDVDEDFSDPAWRHARSGNVNGRQVRYFSFGESVSEGGGD